jgi:hypothetical protein
MESAHTEVVCFGVANPEGGVAVCVERDEELIVAECCSGLEAAMDRARELRAAIEATGLRQIDQGDLNE